MMNKPDTPVHMPQPELPARDSGKLVLPPPVNEYSPVADGQKTVARPLPPLPRPPIVRRNTPPPNQPLAKISYYWHKDPAYKVFIIATCMVLIAGIVFVSLAAAAVVRNPNLFSTSGSNVAQTGPTPTDTVDFQPVFPTPGGSGSTQSSQPPVTSTPALPSTPETTPSGQPQPTPPQNGGTLTVQITSIPSQVFNGEVVQVVVTTSIPGAFVHLQVIYNAPPYYYISATQQADGSGNAILFWHVGVGGFTHGHVTARVFAVATANGQRAISPQVTVQVMNGGIG